MLVQPEKAMAAHSSTLAWKIPWMEEPDRLQSMGSRRVRQDWATSLSLFTFMHWTRTWQATPVFLPGESQGWGSLVGCHLWGHTGSDTTEATRQQQQRHIGSTVFWKGFYLKSTWFNQSCHLILPFALNFLCRFCNKPITILFFTIRSGLLLEIKHGPWNVELQETLVWFLSWEDLLGEGIGYPLQYSWAFLVAQLVKNPLAMWETWVWSLSWEDPLEKGKAAHSSILAWRIPWTV